MPVSDIQPWGFTLALIREKCDWKGCSNKAYREVDYFTNKPLRQKVADNLRTLSEDEASSYVQELFKKRGMSWSFLCRKHFRQERDANRIIIWSTIS